MRAATAYLSVIRLVGTSLAMVAVVAAQSPLPVTEAVPPEGDWRQLEPGLAWAELPIDRPTDLDPGVVGVLRVDPDRFRLRLFMASVKQDGRALTPRQWCRHHGLVAAVNAGMYARDYRTAVSLLRTRRHVNNPRVTKHMAVLAFDPLREGTAPVQIIDRELQDFEELSRHYGSLVQSIRMVAIDGRNVWSAQSRAWSAVAAGIDTAGRVLFVHCRAAYPMRDLIDRVLALPLGLRNMMYLEGGPVAQIYVNAGGEEIELVGAFAPDSPAAGQVPSPSPVPNVIGVMRLVPYAPAEATEHPVPWVLD